MLLSHKRAVCKAAKRSRACAAQGRSYSPRLEKLRQPGGCPLTTAECGFRTIGGTGSPPLASAAGSLSAATEDPNPCLWGQVVRMNRRPVPVPVRPGLARRDRENCPIITARKGTLLFLPERAPHPRSDALLLLTLRRSRSAVVVIRRG